METHIGIQGNHLAESTRILSKVLADEYVLYTKTRNAHWNVEGADFYNKHLFFEAQYNELDELIDSLAERIRSLGHYAVASLKQFLQLTQLTEENRSTNDSKSYIKELLMDHESIIISLRENIDHLASDLKDLGTSDYVTGLMETHEKMAWMLRAHLK
ncbi:MULTISPECIES: Dps family protein [Sphingobacterium]|uniref:Dps family protein n=1 Tax=Sphingobacterium TaxID=28453 RepID=UPI00257F724F|nr:MULTISPECIES: DNA starvation/stationary phase protection protein [Sphingobacterium]